MAEQVKRLIVSSPRLGSFFVSVGTGELSAAFQRLGAEFFSGSVLSGRLNHVPAETQATLLFFPAVNSVITQIFSLPEIPPAEAGGLFKSDLQKAATF